MPPSAPLLQSEMERLRHWVENETGMDLSGLRFPRLQAAVERCWRGRPMPASRLPVALAGAARVSGKRDRRADRRRIVLLPQRVPFPGPATRSSPKSCATMPARARSASGVPAAPPARSLTPSPSCSISSSPRRFLAGLRPGHRPEPCLCRTCPRGPLSAMVVSPDGHKPGPPLFHGRRRMVQPLPEGERTRSLRLSQFGQGRLSLGHDRHARPGPVLFRNVAIYLRPEVTRAIIERFSGPCAPAAGCCSARWSCRWSPPPAWRSGNSSKRRSSKAGRARGLAADRSAVRCAAASRPAGQRADADGAGLPQWAPLPWTTPAPQRPPRPRPRSGNEWNGTCTTRNSLRRSGPWTASPPPRSGPGSVFATPACCSARRSMPGPGDDRSLPQGRAVAARSPTLESEPGRGGGDLAGAEQSYRRALYIDRHCPIAHFHLALVLREGKPEFGPAEFDDHPRANPGEKPAFSGGAWRGNLLW